MNNTDEMWLMKAGVDLADAVDNCTAKVFWTMFKVHFPQQALELEDEINGVKRKPLPALLDANTSRRKRSGMADDCSSF